MSLNDYLIIDNKIDKEPHVVQYPHKGFRTFWINTLDVISESDSSILTVVQNYHTDCPSVPSYVFDKFILIRPPNLVFLPN